MNDRTKLELAIELLTELKTVFAGNAAPHWVNRMETTMTRGRFLDHIDYLLAMRSDETSAPRALAFGDEVTYTPAYGGTRLPREGWKVEVLPKLTYVIKHPNGSLIAVDAGEINAVEPSGDDAATTGADRLGTDPISRASQA
jgi:hypothetical protein